MKHEKKTRHCLWIWFHVIHQDYVSIVARSLVIEYVRTQLFCIWNLLLCSDRYLLISFNMLKPRPLLPVTGDVNFRLARLLNIFYWISLFISLTGTILSNGYFIFHSLKKMTEQAHLCLVMSVNKANVLIKRLTNVTICSIQIHFYYPPRKQSLGVHRNHPVRPFVRSSVHVPCKRNSS